MVKGMTLDMIDVIWLSTFEKKHLSIYNPT